MKKLLLSVLAPVLFLSGCATIMGDAAQTVPIQSQPSGATFKIQDELGNVVQTGVTPASVSLPKGNGKYFGRKQYQVSFEKSGYQPLVYKLQTSPNGWYIGGNLIFGGLLGYLIVDPLSNGKMFTISPKKVDVPLKADADNTSAMQH